LIRDYGQIFSKTKMQNEMTLQRISKFMGLYRVGFDGTRVSNYFDVNGERSFDPALFFTGEYAIDKATLATLIRSNLRYYRYRLGL
jgi:hypothetical protein